MTRAATMGALLALAALMTQMVALRFSGSEMLVRIVLPATIAVVPLALWPHRRFLGVWVLYVGLLANLLPIVANGGLMPIDRATVVEAIGEERAAGYETGEWVRGSKDVLVATGEGRLRALRDQIIIRVGNGGIVASPGDVVVGAGMLLLALEASLAWNRRHTTSEPHLTQRASDEARGGAAT